MISLARSRHPEIEFLLVDDTSTDDTPSVLAPVADRLGRARLVTHEHNRGAVRFPQLGSGGGGRRGYVTFPDGDDWVAPGYFPALLATIERLG